MKQLPFCRDPCLVLLIEKWNSWKDLCFIYIDIFQKVSFEAMLKPEVRFLETQQCLFDRGCAPGYSWILVLGKWWDSDGVHVYSVLSDLLFYLFYWLSSCCWVNLGVCALRCKQMAPNCLSLLQKQPPFWSSPFSTSKQSYVHTLICFTVLSVLSWSSL